MFLCVIAHKGRVIHYLPHSIKGYLVRCSIGYIAELKRMYGLDTRGNYNKSKKEKLHVNYYLQEKVEYIKEDINKLSLLKADLKAL